MTSTEFSRQVIAHLPPRHPWADRITVLDTVDSTNTCLKSMAQQGAPEGTVVIAHRQTGGRGRLGRQFSSPAGLGLYFSLLLRPQCPPQQLMHLTCAAAVAASDAVCQVCGLTPDIKWINDLVVGKRKLGGILTELSIHPDSRQVDYGMIGIGINCHQSAADFPEDIRPIATSLHLEGQSVDRAALAAALMERCQDLYAPARKDPLMESYRSRCVTLGQPVCLHRGTEMIYAQALDVDMDGALVVEYPDGSRQTVTSGEVSVRGMYGYL